MTRKLRARWKAGALEAVHEAGEHVAGAIRSTQATGAKLAGAGFLVGLVVGAGLVWLGVSLARKAT